MNRKDCSNCKFKSPRINPGMLIYLRCTKNNAIIISPVCCKYYERETIKKTA